MGIEVVEEEERKDYIYHNKTFVRLPGANFGSHICAKSVGTHKE